MNAKLASVVSVVVVLLLSSAIVGCPNPVDVADTATTPGDSTDSGSSADATSGGDTTDAGGSAGDSSTGGSTGSTGDGSTGGDSSGATGDAGNTGGTGDSGSGDSTTIDDGGTGDVTPVFTGSYRGDLACAKYESIGGPLSGEKTWTTTFSMTFNQDGIPTGFAVPAYRQDSGPIDLFASVNQVGESETLTLTRPSSPGFSGTLTVTVASATYNETSANVILSLEHHAQQNALTEDGTGICAIQYQLDGDNLLYSSTTTYEVNLSGLVDTIWQVECEGTLSPE
jgi:hypothetical protein